MQNGISYDIVQIGYGPVSQVLALMLAQQGHRVAVVERWSKPYALPRAVSIDHEAARIIHALGLGEGLARVSQPAPRYQLFNADWEELLSINWSAGSVSGGPEVNFVHQPSLKAEFRAKVAGCMNVELNLGSAAVTQARCGFWQMVASPWLCAALIGISLPSPPAQAQDHRPDLGAQWSQVRLTQLSDPVPSARVVPNSSAVPQELQPSNPANQVPDVPPSPLSPRISLPADTIPFEVGKGPKLGKYYLIRSEEDFSYLRNPARSDDLFDPLKFIRLDDAGRVYVTFSGEERFVLKNQTKIGFTFVDPKHQTTLDFRHLYGVDVHVGEHVRAFASLNSGQEGGHNYGQPATVNRDDLVLQQAFVEVYGTAGSTLLGVRGGRQEVWLGSGLLISTREEANIHQSLDGLRGYFDDKNTRIDVFGFNNVIHRFGVLQDSDNAHQHFWGVYGTQEIPIPSLLGKQARIFVDPFYIGTDSRLTSFDTFTGYDNRHTVGGRLWGQVGTADFDVQGAYQTGRTGPAHVSAYSFFSNTGYTFDAPLQPRIGAGFNVGSGGHSTTTDKSYNPLLTSFQNFTESGLIAPINLYEAVVGVSFSPTTRLRVLAYDSFYWRYSPTSGIFNQGYQPFRGTATAKGKAIGMQPALRAAYAVNQHITLSGSLAYFKVDTVFKNAGAKDNTYVAARIRVVF